MAYFPASCDNKCEGCEKNLSSWCIWKDTSIPRQHSNVAQVNTYYNNLNTLEGSTDKK